MNKNSVLTSSYTLYWLVYNADNTEMVAYNYWTVSFLGDTCSNLEIADLNMQNVAVTIEHL